MSQLTDAQQMAFACALIDAASSSDADLEMLAAALAALPDSDLREVLTAAVLMASEAVRLLSEATHRSTIDVIRGLLR